VHRSSGTCPPGMVLHIKGYALQGLISPRHHSNVNHISSSNLSNICITSLTNLLRAQRPYTDPLYKAKEIKRATYWANTHKKWKVSAKGYSNQCCKTRLGEQLVGVQKTTFRQTRQKIGKNSANLKKYKNIHFFFYF
jgi:hypothetical protein